MAKIPYFGKNYMNKHIFHKILYSFDFKFVQENETFLFEGDAVECVMFIVNGNLEVYTEFEGNEFVIEILKPGSILNYRNGFVDDKMLVNVRSEKGGNGTYIS